MITVLAHHLSGPIAAAFALPPLLVVAGAVLLIRRHEPSDDVEFDWADEQDPAER